MGSDPDIELPVVSFTPEQVARRRNRFTTWLISHQGTFFFPILPFEGLSLHASSVRRVLAREPVEHRMVEIALLFVRFAGFTTLVLFVLSPGVAAAFLAVQVGVFGFYMGASFAPNHKGMAVIGPHDTIGFLRRQVITSRNISGGRLLDWVMGGLNYQIEHHLFPSMPSIHLRRAAPIISAYCRDHGIRYTRTSLLASYAIVVRYINTVGMGARDPFDCPLVVERAGSS
jgi:fatty acid desaturase